VDVSAEQKQQIFAVCSTSFKQSGFKLQAVWPGTCLCQPIGLGTLKTTC
jgi:hypothetical protein